MSTIRPFTLNPIQNLTNHPQKLSHAVWLVHGTLCTNLDYIINQVIVTYTTRNNNFHCWINPKELLKALLAIHPRHNDIQYHERNISYAEARSITKYGNMAHLRWTAVSRQEMRFLEKVVEGTRTFSEKIGVHPLLSSGPTTRNE
ncbi:MAG: hypothetical protein WCG29_01990 [Desulfomonile sp.]